ncbi:MAG: lytic transglycosylase domain-containing protein [Deltaproteobacteria bacterium]|nr:lytic transglycosylase domain-containing protein [Candidatus Anaeroferrophillus wilburensis]MBN2889165.1 lytic transglycosylase domain-containing protein [Deltaproteobacteria bacterium]
MNMMNRKRTVFSNLVIAAAFVLIVAATCQMPAMKQLWNQQATGIQTAPQASSITSLENDRCSLDAFHRLMVNIQQQRQSLSPSHTARLARFIWQAGYRFDCDPQLIAAVIQIESSFLNRAHSHKGARGLMQLRPFVAREMARRLETSWDGPQTLHDPEANILMGTYYLSSLIRDFSDLPTALVAYNYGPTYVRRQLRNGRQLPTSYPAKILSLYQSFEGNRS